jgi:hypothetical protein
MPRSVRPLPIQCASVWWCWSLRPTDHPGDTAGHLTSRQIGPRQHAQQARGDKAPVAVQAAERKIERRGRGAAEYQQGVARQPIVTQHVPELVVEVEQPTARPAHLPQERVDQRDIRTGVAAVGELS